METKLLRIMLLIMAIFGTCLASPADVNVNEAQLQRSEAYYKSQRPTSANQAPPAASSPSSESSSTSQRRRDTNMGSYDDINSGGPRPTATKTPAPYPNPEKTKVPVAVSTSAASTVTTASDTGFVLLGAALGVISLGMALV